MSYTIEEIKRDLATIDEYQFYLKHIVRSDNWYFENVLGIPKEDLMKVSDDFRMIISGALNIHFNNIFLVGSGKVGYSLSPTEKAFSPFSIGGEKRPASDLDVAVISPDLFNKYWWLFRKSYRSKYTYLYRNYVYNGIYRGYINEKWIDEVDECRREWATQAATSKKQLENSLFIKHQVTYRIYRSLEDFEEYNLKNITKLREKL